ncbi:monocarboxylate transporter 14-like [Watersipora subatra]|uniref:monocarboxylate transporter 14-like n=1 Tax=Watersipora subatra TaxID=2589382 RepID=UPI00355BADBF
MEMSVKGNGETQAKMSVAKKMCTSLNYKKDTGYAWVVLLMSTLSHFAHLGFTFGVIGNMTIVNQTHFGIGLQLSSLIGTIHMATIFFFGLISSMLVKKLGCRVTEILGGICLLLGLGLSYFSKEAWHAILLYSLLSAVGISCTYVASSQVLALAFDKYKYLAFSVAVLGQKGGAVALPITSQTLFDRYGYSRAMAIMSAFHLIHIIAGFLFFSPKDGMIDDIEMKDTTSGKAEIDSDTDEGGQVNSAMDAPEEDEKQPEDAEYRKEEMEIKSSRERERESVEISLRKKLALLLQSPKIWAFLINACLWNLNMVTFQVLLNDFIVHHIQLTKQEASLGVTVSGAVSVFGCILVIFLSRVKFDRVILHFSCCLLLGCATILTAFTVNKEMFYSLSAVYGLTQGTLLGNLLGVVNDLVYGDNLLALLFGLELFAEGVGALSGTPLASYISESVGEQYGIVLAGCSGLTASLVMLPVMIYRMRHRPS